MNLQEPGQEFYDSVLAEFDFTGEPGKLAILERAARTTDRIAQLEQAAAEAPLMVKGSQGQQVISPLIAEARAQTSLLEKLIKALGLPATDEEELEKREKRTRAARKAANARRGARS